MNTLYMADLDGTLLNSKGELSDYTKTTLNALIAHGLPFTVNTSRTPKSVTPKIKGLNLKLNAVLMNGSCFFDTKSGKTESLVLLDKAPAAAALNVCRRFGCEPFLFELINGDVSVRYTSAKLAQSQKFMRDRAEYYPEFTATPSPMLAREAAYIVCADKTEKLKTVKAALANIKGIACSLFFDDGDETALLEIYNSAAGKQNATRRFMEQYGFDRVVAFGDNLNDTEMLENADIGLAVANAKPAAKAAASEVIESCDNDGVAKWLLLEWSRRPELY